MPRFNGMDNKPPLSTTMFKIFQIQQKIHVENEYWLQILAQNKKNKETPSLSLFNLSEII